MTWTRVGLWRRLHQWMLDQLERKGAIDWSRAIIDAVSLRAKGWADRPKPRSTGLVPLVTARPRCAPGVDPAAVARPSCTPTKVTILPSCAAG